VRHGTPLSSKVDGQDVRRFKLMTRFHVRDMNKQQGGLVLPGGAGAIKQRGDRGGAPMFESQLMAYVVLLLSLLSLLYALSG